MNYEMNYESNAATKKKRHTRMALLFAVCLYGAAAILLGIARSNGVDQDELFNKTKADFVHKKNKGMDIANHDYNRWKENDKFNHVVKDYQSVIQYVGFGVGLLLTLVGRRFSPVALFTGGFVLSSFVLYHTLQSQMINGSWAHSAPFDKLSANGRAHLSIIFSGAIGLLTGILCVIYRKVGMASVAGSVAFFTGVFAFQVILTPHIPANYDWVNYFEYVIAFFLALSVFVLTYKLNRFLLILLTVTFGSFMVLFYGMSIFSTKLSDELNTYAWRTRKFHHFDKNCKNFPVFLGTLLGTFCIGLMSQFVIDPYISEQCGTPKRNSNKDVLIESDNQINFV